MQKIIRQSADNKLCRIIILFLFIQGQQNIQRSCRILGCIAHMHNKYSAIQYLAVLIEAFSGIINHLIKIFCFIVMRRSGPGHNIFIAIILQCLETASADSQRRRTEHTRQRIVTVNLHIPHNTRQLCICSFIILLLLLRRLHGIHALMLVHHRHRLMAMRMAGNIMSL